MNATESYATSFLLTTLGLIVMHMRLVIRANCTFTYANLPDRVRFSLHAGDGRSQPFGVLIIEPLPDLGTTV